MGEEDRGSPVPLQQGLNPQSSTRDSLNHRPPSPGSLSVANRPLSGHFYTCAMVVTILGGIGLFLIGMSLMSDGLKALAGGALRDVLTRVVAGPWSALGAGAAVTAVVQSSSATTLMTIGFVSAGLISFQQAVGVIFGANLGTTSTGWLVSVLGFKVSMGAIALPVVFVGAMGRILARGRLSAAGLALAGFGLIFVGIGLLQQGMVGLQSYVDPSMLDVGGFFGRLLMVMLGIAMTVVMQSSSAAMATTLAALDSGVITLDQAAALVIGQNVGTTVKAGLAAIGASVPAKRTAMAHFLFNAITGAVAFAILPLFLWGASAMNLLHEGPIALAAFHTVFNVLGVAILLPISGRFARLVERIIPDRGDRLTRFLDVSVTQLGPVAIEAARRCVVEIMRETLEDLRQILDGARPRADHIVSLNHALDEVHAFLHRLGAGEQSDAEVRQHLAILHAAEHASLLVGACERAPAAASLRTPDLDPQIAALEDMIVEAHAWLANPATSAPAQPMADAAANIERLRRTIRLDILQHVAKRSREPTQAATAIEALRWGEEVAHRIARGVAYLEANSDSNKARNAPFN